MNDLDPTITLAVRGLSVAYRARRGMVQAIRDVSFEVRRGEALALIGESGSGKTTLGLSIVRLLAGTARVQAGQILYQGLGRQGDKEKGRQGDKETGRQGEDGEHLVRKPQRANRNAQITNVLALNPRQLRLFRWKEAAMVFQAALNAFNPVLRISDHFADTSRAHGGPRGKALQTRAYELLRQVRLDPDRVWRAYPHELSGGMRQRVLIALGLLLEPQLLILDEPTTALDILTQRNIMDVLKELREKLDFALVFISHDLALAAELADRVATVYAGKIVEIGTVERIFRSPSHPYTIGLIGAVPTLEGKKDDLTSIPGAPPDLIDLPTGCKFHPRCSLASERCRTEEPDLETTEGGHQVACWHWREALGATTDDRRLTTGN